jgi:D-alanyl-D-alanine dipeptidase
MRKLEEVMVRHGFELYPFEWWHYDFHGWENYPVLDFPFEAIRPVGK